MSTFTYVCTETLPIGLLLSISADLSVSTTAAGLLVTGYGLVVVLTAIPLTLLTRRIPRRRLIPGLLLVFAAANSVSVAAPNYATLMCSRLVVALSQAVFWSVVVPAAAGLFTSRVQGRVIAVVFAGASIAAVLGVPIGTTLGQRAGWRASFVILTVLGLAAAAVLASLLPSGDPATSHPERAGTTAPDRRRYAALLVTTALATTGAFTSYTYITPFLTDISGFAVSAIGPLLLARGLAGTAGVAIGGLLVDHRPWAATLVPVALQSASLLALHQLGDASAPAAVLIALAALAFTALNAALASLVLHLAPASPDVAAAGAATATNVGITTGAFIGGALLQGPGVRATALVGALLSVAALIVAAAGLRPRRRGHEMVGVSPAVSTPAAVPVRIDR